MYQAKFLCATSSAHDRSSWESSAQWLTHKRTVDSQLTAKPCHSSSRVMYSKLTCRMDCLWANTGWIPKNRSNNDGYLKTVKEVSYMGANIKSLWISEMQWLEGYCAFWRKIKKFRTEATWKNFSPVHRHCHIWKKWVMRQKVSQSL